MLFRTIAPCLLFLLLVVVPASVASSGQRLKSMRQLRLGQVTQQTRDYSCGAASMNMLLRGYFQDMRFDESILLQDIICRLNEEELRSRVKDGFSMLDLRHLAMRLGYEADGVILPREALMHLKGPVIVLLRKGEYRHFVVLRGARTGSVYLLDPIAGRVRMPIHEFFSQWSGETLVLGREDFGLPAEHGLSITSETHTPTEADAVRMLQSTPFIRKHSQ